MEQIDKYGYIRVPEVFRELRGIEEGDWIDFHLVEGGIVMVRRGLPREEMEESLNDELGEEIAKNVIQLLDAHVEELENVIQLLDEYMED